MSLSPTPAAAAQPVVSRAAARTRTPALPAPSGPVLFARYAFGPNRLGLCGPEDWRSLLELGAAAAAERDTASGGASDAAAASDADAVAGGSASASRSVSSRALEIDRGLRDLAAGFEGAYPYLELIAAAHAIEDPMDPRVVDAYWIGNGLSDRVDPGLMTQSIDARFRSQLAPEAWKWLADKPAAGARPTHAFHVFDIFPRVGLMRGGAVTDAVGLMDSCRIRWGRVLEVRGESLVVNAVPLGLVEGKLALAEPRAQTVRRWLDGTGFVSDVEPGDVVSMHWDWACEVLSDDRLGALQRRTQHSLELANQTI